MQKRPRVGGNSVQKRVLRQRRLFHERMSATWETLRIRTEELQQKKPRTA